MGSIGAPARRDHGRKRELCEDVMVHLLLVGFGCKWFGFMLSQVQGEVAPTGYPIPVVDGLTDGASHSRQYFPTML
jgi:hypothetical protein